ncbi:MAG: site-specific integrase [Clostridia bacterium]|nr:site-specific integrase [Clostridia bacterium]
MPDDIKHIFVVNNRVVNYRIIRGMYQIRFHRDGYDIEVASKSLTEVKKKFIDALNTGTRRGKKKMFPTLKEFSATWLKYKQPVVKESTYKTYVLNLEANIYPALGDTPIDMLNRETIQDFLNGLVEEGRCRTAGICKQLLGAIFKLAVEDLEIKDPMTKIVLPHYEKKKSTALKKDEEKTLVEYCKQHPKTKGCSGVIILLYTGMRAGELKSLTHDEKFIYCISEKTRKGYADVTRKIPISPMMKKMLPYIDIDNSIDVSMWTMRDVLKELFPTRHLHELRYTFITRAKECGINTEVVMLMDGHESDRDCFASKVDRGYTDFSEEFILKEMEKFDYEL